jgi:glycosyltransferase involved in cell wall biosynthesis
MQVLLAACGAAHLPNIACALQPRNALAGLWVTVKNRYGIAPDKYRRAWIFHLAMKPFYYLPSAGTVERIHHALFPIWRAWFRRQKPPPFDVAHAILGYGSEPFEMAEKVGALKVVDASTSHPTSGYGFWQRECDVWSPGARPGVPRWIFARSNRELERADLILCPSVFVRDTMLYNGIPEAKCVLNPYGVDTSIFTPRAVVPEKSVFVCVGAIGLRKGYQYLFRAFEKVRQVLPEAELICAGTYMPDFRRERPRWEGQFTHYQRLPHEELAKLLRNATAFVFPSNEEGFARAIVEAMSAGLPIVATYESGATTLVEHGVHGLIVKSRDSEGLAAAMLKIATDRALNERMGQAAHARGAVKNTWDDYTGRLLEICGAARERQLARRQT